MVKALARDSGRNCLYFYPQDYLDEAERRGPCDKDAMMRHGKRWVVEDMEGVPYIKPWKTVLTKRAPATVAYLVIALPVAGIAMAL